MLEKGQTYLPPLFGMHDMIASLSEIPVVSASLGPGLYIDRFLFPCSFHLDKANVLLL